METAMENLELRRNDLVQTSATSKGTLVIFPPGSNKQQRIGVGDLSGVVQCFSIRHQQHKLKFKSLPSGAGITAMTLGRGSNQRDKIYMAEGSAIRGLTKTGKEFFKFDTNFTEAINSVWVMNSHLVIFGDHCSIIFEDNKEKSFHVSPDRINASAVLVRDEGIALALACQDRSIRVVKDGLTILQTTLNGVPSDLVTLPNDYEASGGRCDEHELLCGTENGTLAQLFIRKSEIRSGFVLQNPLGRGCVTAIHVDADTIRNESRLVATGRDDGHFEIYSVSEANLQKIFETRLPDRINTVASGFVTSSLKRDFVVQTYSGKVIAYCPPGSGLFSLSNEMGSARRLGLELSDRLDCMISDTRSQIAHLSSQIQEKRSRSETVSEELDGGTDIRHSCRLNVVDKCFVLDIDTEKPIFCAALCCDSRIELLPAGNDVAILSQSPPDLVNGFPVLATFRCQEYANRLQIRFRAGEGKSRRLAVFILPKMRSRMAYCFSHVLPPLCLHERVREAEVGPCSEIILSGGFSRNDLCFWLRATFQEFPRQWPEEGKVFFRSVLNSDTIEIEGKEGSLFIRGKDLSSLDILKGTVVSEATKRNLEVNTEAHVDRSSVEDTLARLWRKSEIARSAAERTSLLKAVGEIRQMVDGDSIAEKELKETLASTAESPEGPGLREDPAAAVGDIFRCIDLYRKFTGSAKDQISLDEIDRIINTSSSTLEDILFLL